MGSDPRSGERDATEPWAYTSQSYAAATDEAAMTFASSWLEEQALHPFIQEVGARSLARLALGQGDAVLELGCGTGVFLPGLADLVGPTGRVVGLDHSPAFLALARERLDDAGLSQSVELVEADAHHVPFDDATFDAAHAERVFMHLEDPAAALRELCRVVRPGGRVVVAEVFAEGATIDHPDVAAVNLINERMAAGSRNPRMGIQLRALFVDSGLTEIDGDVVGIFEQEYHQDEADEFTRIARDLAKSGSLDHARAEAAIAEMEDRRARGTYCGLALIFVVVGHKPGNPAHASSA